MSSYRWIWIVLLAGLMLSLPRGDASAVSIDLRPQGPTTFDVGETLNVDVYLLLDEADRAATIDAVTMQFTGGGGLVAVTADTTGSVFNPHPPSVVNVLVSPHPADFIAVSQFGAPLASIEGFLFSLTLTGAIAGSYDLVALRVAPGPPLMTSPSDPTTNRFDFSDESLTITIVPEPGTLVLLGASLAGLAFLRRRVA